MLPLAILLGSLFGIGVLLADRLSGDDFDEGEVAADQVTAVSLGHGSSTLIVNALDDDAVAFTVMVLGDVTGGTVVLVPASTMVEVPGFGLEPVSRAHTIGGVELAALSLRNLLSINFDHVVTIDPGQWTALVRPLGELEVENPGRLDRLSAQGRVQVMWPPGQVTLEPEEVSGFLAQRGVDEADLQRLVRHQQFWVSFMEARGAVVGLSKDPTVSFDSFLDVASLRSDELQYRILPVDTLGGPDGLYVVDRDGLASLLDLVGPGSLAGDKPRTRVQILNGVGIPGLAEPVTALILPAGATVELSGNALSFDHQVTQIIYYRDEQVEMALRLQEHLGVGEVVKHRDPIDVVDVTVVIGADLVDRYGLV